MTETTFPSLGHDHGGCVHEALAWADAHCARQGVRLTPLRRRVLELVWESHAPVGAYALLDHLKSEGQNAAPPTVYRALDFLLEQGLVHKLERLNAFIGCNHRHARGDGTHAAQFMICTQCGRAVELDDPAIDQAVQSCAQRLGFSVLRQTVEVEGLCPHCQGPN